MTLNVKVEVKCRKCVTRKGVGNWEFVEKFVSRPVTHRFDSGSVEKSYLGRLCSDLTRDGCVRTGESSGWRRRDSEHAECGGV